uniref:Putative secreted protein n=1 Tax=Ixodes ricinus TaxID=34613 RepID=A0A6B0UE58_IXORI
MRPMATSVASTALTAASYTPVCPTMSGGAKLHMTKGCFFAWTTLTISSATPLLLISGKRSYVATLGEGTMHRSSSAKAFSWPPLKKKVTWAYFSVSAQ